MYWLNAVLIKATADLRYYAGVFNGEGPSVLNPNDNMMKMARLQWNPLGVDLKWRQSDVKRHRKPGLSLAGACGSQNYSHLDPIFSFSKLFNLSIILLGSSYAKNKV